MGTGKESLKPNEDITGHSSLAVFIPHESYDSVTPQKVFERTKVGLHEWDIYIIPLKPNLTAKTPKREIIVTKGELKAGIPIDELLSFLVRVNDENNDPHDNTENIGNNLNAAKLPVPILYEIYIKLSELAQEKIAHLEANTPVPDFNDRVIEILMRPTQ